MLRSVCRNYRRCALVLALVSPLWLGGCLPDPEITVPDFKPSGIVDLATSRMDLGTQPDAARLRWLPDQSVRTGQTLRAIVTSSSQVFAIGHQGTILRRSGTGWISEPAVDGTKTLTSNLYGAVSVGSDFYAVGESGVIVKRSVDKWQQEGKELALSTSLFAVTETSAGELYAVGDAGVILRKPMGGAWTKDSVDPALSSADFRAIAPSTADELFAVGLGGVIARRSGGKWSVDSVSIDSADRGNFYSVVLTSDAVFVAGEYGLFIRRDADKWRRESPIVQGGQRPHFLSLGVSGRDLTVVGSLGIIARRDAVSRAWTSEDSGTTVTLSAVSSSQPIYAVGAQGTVLVRQ